MADHTGPERPGRLYSATPRLGPEAPVLPVASGVNSARERLPLVFVVVFFVLVFPAYFEIWGLLLSTSRVVLLGLTPVLLIRLFKGDFGPLIRTDFLIMLYVFWLGVSIWLNNPEAFVTFVGSNSLIILGGYLVGRAYIRTPGAFIGFGVLYGLTVIFFLPFAVQETITTKRVIADFIDGLPGLFAEENVNYDRRLGFDRVQQTFSHPIHFGVFCALAFSPIFVGMRGRISTPLRWLWSAAIGLSCFLSVSSGPFLAMMCQLGLIFYANLMQRVRRLWTVLAVTSGLTYIVLEILSDRPAYYAIVERLSFNPHTANVRRILLEYGLPQIGRTPVFGVGYNDWELPSFMSGSLDNYWLLTALVYGIPAFIGAFGGFIYTLIAINRTSVESGPDVVNLRRAWSFSLFSLVLILATVSVWSEIATLIFVCLGATTWMIHYKPADAAVVEKPAQAPVSSASRAQTHKKEA